VALAVLGAITGVLAARLLGPAGEGELTAIQSWPINLGTIALLGLDFAVVYFIARQPDQGRQYTSTAVLVGLISVLAVDTAAWFALPTLLSAQSQQVISAARVFLLIGIIYALIVIPRGSFRGAKLFTTWNLSRIAPGIAWLCILIASRVAGHPSAIPLSRLYMAAILICGIPFLVILSKTLRGPLKPDARLAPRLLRFGLPSALTSLPQTVNLQLDQMLIIAFLPARSLGLYVIAVSWSGAVTPLLSAIGSVLSPTVSAEKDTARQGQLLATALQGGAVIAVLTAAPFMLLAPVGLPFIFGSSFTSAVPSAIVLVPAAAIFAWAGIAEEGLRGLGRPGIILIAEVSAAVVTLAALSVLLHAYGIFGAAIASLVGYSTIAVFCVMAMSRSTQITVSSLVIPDWQTTKELLLRSISLIPGCGGRERDQGRHRKHRT
jgi:O-antigen/teichoic acid export membrane protein